MKACRPYRTGNLRPNFLTNDISSLRDLKKKSRRDEMSIYNMLKPLLKSHRDDNNFNSVCFVIINKINNKKFIGLFSQFIYIFLNFKVY